MVEVRVLFLMVDVVVWVGLIRDTCAADLLVFLHEALGVGLPAVGTGLAVGRTFVRMCI